MSTPYTEDCISFTGVFEEPFGYPIFTEHMEIVVRDQANTHILVLTTS